MGLKNNTTFKLIYELKNSFCTDISQVDMSISNEVIKTVTLNDSYVKILSVEGNKSTIILNVGFYKKEDKSQLIQTKQYEFSPDVSNSSDNFIKQGYEYLKTLPEFSGAIDVLDDGQML